MAKKILDKTALLKKLPQIKYEAKDEKTAGFEEKMSFERALLGVLQIDHEHEYDLCRSMAQHLLEEVPEPDEIETDQ